MGLIYSLLNRPWKVCSGPKELDKEVNNIRSILAKNEYLEKVVNNEIQKFIRNHQNAPGAISPQSQTEQIVGPEK